MALESGNVSCHSRYTKTEPCGTPRMAVDDLAVRKVELYIIDIMVRHHQAIWSSAVSTFTMFSLMQLLVENLINHRRRIRGIILL